MGRVDSDPWGCWRARVSPQLLSPVSGPLLLKQHLQSAVMGTGLQAANASCAGGAFPCGGQGCEGGRSRLPRATRAPWEGPLPGTPRDPRRGGPGRGISGLDTEAPLGQGNMNTRPRSPHGEHRCPPPTPALGWQQVQVRAPECLLPSWTLEASWGSPACRSPQWSLLLCPIKAQFLQQKPEVFFSDSGFES